MYGCYINPILYTPLLKSYEDPQESAYKRGLALREIVKLESKKPKKRACCFV